MAKSRTMTGFNGGGASYNLTPESVLEDLGVKVIKENPPYPLFKKGGMSRCAFTLAEGATHVDMFHDIRKSAFTLAEVLVTIGIIGIVAAMTLPMLVENYQRIVIQTRLKKFYTTFNQAILRAVDEHGPYEYWSYNEDEEGSKGKVTREQIDNVFNYYLRPYMNIVQTQEVHYTNGKSSTLYYLTDGSAFNYKPGYLNDILYYPKAPVRCLKQPAVNREGVCSFLFIFAPNINLLKTTIHYYRKGLVPYSWNWNGKLEMLYSDAYGCNLDKYGYYCTLLIQYNNWEFPKDYPRKIRY